jgi:hypothetical protein
LALAKREFGARIDREVEASVIRLVTQPKLRNRKPPEVVRCPICDVDLHPSTLSPTSSGKAISNIRLLSSHRS